MTALEAIQAIVADKQSRGTFPAVALSIEVSRLMGMPLSEVEAAAVQLEAQGLISIGEGLNYNYFKLK